MKTYLDMDEVLWHCRRYIGQEYDEPYLVSAVPEEVIRSLPAADVVEVRHGKWILDGGYHMCSECYDYAPYYEDGEERLSYFCPFCGADMRGE